MLLWGDREKSGMLHFSSRMGTKYFSLTTLDVLPTWFSPQAKSQPRLWPFPTPAGLRSTLSQCHCASRSVSTSQDPRWLEYLPGTSAGQLRVLSWKALKWVRTVHWLNKTKTSLCPWLKTDSLFHPKLCLATFPSTAYQVLQ